MRGRMKVNISGISFALCLMAICPTVARAVEIPVGPFAELKSEDFGKRETAQEELIAWSRLQPDAAMDAFFQQSRVADDPEVRERCLAILRELVNDEYSKDGEGYIGIRMRDEEMLLPEGNEPRGVIRVIEVVRDSAAAKAGLQLNDLIFGFDDVVLKEKLISLPFMDKIRQLKPNSKITLNLFRDGKMMQIPVILGRRPPMLENTFFGEPQVDPEAAERAAKENYFRRWLERRKAEN